MNQEKVMKFLEELENLSKLYGLTIVPENENDYLFVSKRTANNEHYLGNILVDEPCS